MQSPSPTTHNLNLNMYSFNEILGLFDLNYSISIDDMKRAKKKVLMTHPDKSKLPPEYFLFYKKAFDMVYKYYVNETKQSHPIPESVSYKPIKPDDLNKTTTNGIKNSIEKMDQRVFHEKFNELFETNMSSKPNAQKNEWFTKDEPIYKTDQPISSGNIGRVFETLKSQNSSLVRHQNVSDLYIRNGIGANLYDETEEDETMYAESDIFSHLKFDDLRKVHKDQTIFAVSESDYKNIPKYASVDQLNHSRGSQNLKPLEKTHAEKMLEEQEMLFKKKMINKQHESELKTQKYNELNKNVLATFLQLKN